MNRCKLSDFFEYFAEKEQKIKKWFYENKHPIHDYSLISSNLRIPSLASRSAGADRHFISSLLEGSLDFPELLSSISFRVPSHSARNHSLFNYRTIALPMDSTTHSTECHAASTQPSLSHCLPDIYFTY